MHRGKLIATVVAGGVALIALSAAITWEIAARHSAAKPQGAANRQDVYPPELRGTKSLELGELVLLLMPDSGTHEIGWDHRVNSPILWQTSGFDILPRDGTERVGFVRVNIQGKIATVLRQRVDELGWSVTYWTDDLPKFGPSEIQIQPGAGEGVSTCFGTAFDGCDFEEPIASLVSAGIQVKRLCSKELTQEQMSAFLITHPKRRQTILVWATGGGSGGFSSSLTLKLKDAPDSTLCNKYLKSPPS